MFERILAMSPESGLALENLGALDLELERGAVASARQRFAHAAQVDPRSSHRKRTLDSASPH